MKVEIIKSDIFNDWLKNVRDKKARAVIDAHIYRMSVGNSGDVKSVGNKIFEKRIFFGAGYRLYFVVKGSCLIVLLCGGSKSTQEKDIKLAQKIAKEMR